MRKQRAKPQSVKVARVIAKLKGEVWLDCLSSKYAHGIVFWIWRDGKGAWCDKRGRIIEPSIYELDEMRRYHPQWPQVV